MDWIFFAQTATAVMLGNGLSFLFAYAAWRVTREEKRTGGTENVPGWVFFAGAAPFLLGIFAIYFMPNG